MTITGGINEHGVFDTAAAVSGVMAPSGTPQPIGLMSGPLPQYANDAAARAAGLSDWALYLNNGGVQQLQGSANV